MRSKSRPAGLPGGGDPPGEELLPPTGLVLTGGAIRSAFGAGALKAMADLGLTDFAVAQAVSGSAPNLAYFAAGQDAELWAVWSECIGTKRFVDYGSLWRSSRARAAAPLFNTHYLVDEVFGQEVPLDTARLGASSIQCRFLTAKVQAGELRLAAFGNDHPQLLPVLKACLALPSCSPSPIAVNGDSYVDGCLIEPIPLCNGEGRPLARRTLVILNSPRNRDALRIRRTLQPFLFRGVSGQHPAVESAARRRWHLEQQSRKRLRAAERRGEVMVLAPRYPTPASALSRSGRRIRQTLKQGYREALLQRRALEEFLGGAVSGNSELRTGRPELPWGRGREPLPA